MNCIILLLTLKAQFFATRALKSQRHGGRSKKPVPPWQSASITFLNYTSM
jgi:hypothetical protein